MDYFSAVRRNALLIHEERERDTHTRIFHPPTPTPHTYKEGKRELTKEI